MIVCRFFIIEFCLATINNGQQTLKNQTKNRGMSHFEMLNRYSALGNSLLADINTKSIEEIIQKMLMMLV